MSPNSSHTPPAVDPPAESRGSIFGVASAPFRDGAPRDADERRGAATATLVHGIHGSFAAAGSLREAWNDLARREGDLFSSYDWCDTWWQYYGKGRRLEIHTLEAGEELVGVLPLFRETLLLGGACLRVVRLVGSDHTLDAAGLAIEPDYVEALLERVLGGLAARGRWDVLQFGPLRHYATISEAVRDACARHEAVQAVIHGSCDSWITQFDLPRTYEAYLEGLLPVDRRNLLRRERNLQSKHPARVAAAREPAEVDRAMEALVQLHGQLWTAKGQRGVFEDWPAYAAFHRDVARRLAGSGQLALVSLEAEGQTYGVIYGYHHGRRTHSMISGYPDDAEWRSYGIGRLLHCHITRQAIEHGAELIDDGRGVFEHKRRYGGQLFGERSVVVLRRGWTHRVRFCLALRVAYGMHVVYCRIWRDRIAAYLGMRRPLRRSYIHSSFLAQLYRRVQFGLFGEPAVQEARHEPRPPSTTSTPPGGPAA